MPALSTMPNASIPAGLQEDAAPKTLYASRPLKNGADLVAWARAAGFRKTLAPDDMHVTIAFSKAPLVWPEPVAEDAVAPDAATALNGTRAIEQLGDEGAIVLRFESPELTRRWHALCAAGAEWGYPTFKPHVTFTMDAGNIDLAKVQPYAGPLEFGPEVFKEIGDRGADWADKARAGMVSEDSAMDGLTLALDESMRSFDDYGHMHVKVSNISKAQIRPYLGREIPGWNDEEETHLLGLDPDETYNMLCPADELAKSVKAWNGKPLLLIHKPSEADEHPTEETIGSVYNVDFVDPYLRAALSVWRQEGIDLIETEEQREISCGYGYDPDMTAGVFNGEPYQGVMRNLRPNHVAIVDEGRAGPDVLVADSVVEHQWALIEQALVEGWAR